MVASDPKQNASTGGPGCATLAWNGPTAHLQLAKRAPVLAAIDPKPWGPREYKIRLTKVGPVEICETEASAHGMQYTPRRTKDRTRSPQGLCCIHLQLEGDASIHQGKNHAVLRPGDLGLFDLCLPFQAIYPADTRHAVFAFPQRLMKMPAGVLAGLTSIQIPGDSGLAKSVSPFLETIVRDVGGFGDSGGPWLEWFFQSVAGLVTAVYMERAAVLKLDRQSSHQLMLREVSAFIEANLWDPDLNPTQIAKAHYISVRQLHSLFSRQGATVSEWIRTRRLEECRNDLSSPVFMFEPVASIALRHGFLDAAHFSRLFRAAFGETPSGFRSRLAQASAEVDRGDQADSVPSHESAARRSLRIV